MKSSLKKIIKRVITLSKSRVAGSFFDQGIVSLGNFLTNMLLGRYLSQDDYGSFVLINNSIFLFLNSIHNSLVVYPLSVKGSVVDRAELSKLTTNYSIFTTILAAVCSVILLSAMISLQKLYIFPVATCALVLWQIQETLRRALIAHLRYEEVIWGDGLSYLGQAGAVWFLAQMGWLSFETTFLAIALTSAIAALVQALQIQLKTQTLQSLSNTITTSWSLGKWFLFGSITATITQHSTPWILAIFHDKKTTATVQALTNIVGVSNPIISSTTSLMIPTVAKANQEGGMKAVKSAVIKYSLPGFILLIPFFTILVLYPKTILAFIYGSTSPYVTANNTNILLQLLVLSQLILYVTQIPSSILAGLEKSKSAFLGQIGSILSSLLIGIPSIVKLGDFGVIISSISANIMRMSINSYQIFNWQKIMNKNAQMFDNEK